jgi:hypothetical protein
MSTTTRRSGGRAAVAVTCVLAAAAYLTIGLVHDNKGLAIGGTAVMLGYGAILLLFGRRSEPVALLAGEQSDERQRLVMLRASAATGQVLVVVLVGGAMWSLAAQSDAAAVFCGLCAVGGATFAGSTAWYSRRG